MNGAEAYAEITLKVKVCLEREPEHSYYWGNELPYEYFAVREADYEAVDVSGNPHAISLLMEWDNNGVDIDPDGTLTDAVTHALFSKLPTQEPEENG